MKIYQKKNTITNYYLCYESEKSYEQYICYYYVNIRTINSISLELFFYGTDFF